MFACWIFSSFAYKFLAPRIISCHRRHQTAWPRWYSIKIKGSSRPSTRWTQRIIKLKRSKQYHTPTIKTSCECWCKLMYIWIDALLICTCYVDIVIRGDCRCSILSVNLSEYISIVTFDMLYLQKRIDRNWIETDNSNTENRTDDNMVYGSRIDVAGLIFRRRNESGLHVRLSTKNQQPSEILLVNGHLKVEEESQIQTRVFRHCISRIQFLAYAAISSMYECDWLFDCGDLSAIFWNVSR